MMLRISAALAILIGLFFAYETITGFSIAYRYAQGQEAYVTGQFALRGAFIVALVGGGVLAFWLQQRTLLATAWGIVVGMTAPHLIRPSIPLALIQQNLAHGGNAHIVSVEPREFVLVGIAVLGIILCGLSELQRPSGPNT